MGIPSQTRIKISLPVFTAIICALAFVVLLSTQNFGSNAYLRRKSAKKSISGEEVSVRESARNYGVDDRFEFDPEECSLVEGRWVFNRSIEPLYSDRICPYLDRQVTCVENGRLDSDYRYWEWQPDDCILPRFDPRKVLEKLRGKRLMFVGDSLQRGQWQSFVCLVESVIPNGVKSMKRGRLHSVFKAEDYNATVEFYWAPFLVEANSEFPVDLKKRILRVDSVGKHGKHWIGVDFLVFNTYVWWISDIKTKSLWGSFANEQGYQELDTPIAYKIGLKTWANWVDSNVDPNKTRVFFTKLSPTHLKSADWGNLNGTKCFNETKPIANKRYWGSSSDKGMIGTVAQVVAKMKVLVTLVNVTQLSEYRVDAHTSVYSELRGKLLTDEEKADPLHYADCIHWCLPGVPDTWNRILYAHLLWR
ncbi:hypothetical protein STAS_33475 [Striga asiatica]|uniref:Uncharacterized protein n=1 Tax=Striga asiatica TaxID=4170 RepID=A0A5A7RF34_STRAF|nr:hypothetical protein STAS_33475 [Striga asiatica]